MNTQSLAPKRRRPWLAALLSLLVSGLGQLYNGQPLRAALFFGISLSLDVTWAFVVPSAFVIFEILLGIAAFALMWKLGAIVDAFVQARRRGEIPLAASNRWYVYAGVLIVAVAGDVALSGRDYESFSIPSASNMPNLHPGDYVMALAVSPLDVHRGDMVIFHLPRDPKIPYIKRVIGMPGDRIELRKGQVFINDVPVERTRIEDYELQTIGAATPTVAQYRESLPGGKSVKVLQIAGETGQLSKTRPVTVPAGQYFVLGDNRDNSLDSRVPAEFQGVGMVPAAAIYRKPLYIYWAKDRSRIGLPVD